MEKNQEEKLTTHAQKYLVRGADRYEEINPFCFQLSHLDGFPFSRIAYRKLRSTLLILQRETLCGRARQNHSLNTICFFSVSPRSLRSHRFTAGLLSRTMLSSLYSDFLRENLQPSTFSVSNLFSDSNILYFSI